MESLSPTLTPTYTSLTGKMFAAMSAILLDGTRIASEIKAEVAAEAQSLISAGVRPGLAAVLVGNNPASEIYVRNKVRACEALGFFSEQIVLSEAATTAEILKVVQQLNSRNEIDGILVQLPLPHGVDSRQILLAVDPAKDADGLHPFNVGNLSGNHPTLVACTPRSGFAHRSHLKPIPGRRYDLPSPSTESTQAQPASCQLPVASCRLPVVSRQLLVVSC